MFNRKNVENIDLTSFKINKLEPDILTIYDRYELKFRLKTGEEKNITLYADKGTVPENIPNEYIGKEAEYNSKQREFFLSFLFKSNERESEIYIGSFNYANNGKPVNDILSSTKDGLQSKNDLFNLLMEGFEEYKNGEITYEFFMETFPELAENKVVKEKRYYEPKKQEPEKTKEDRAKGFRNSLNPDNFSPKTETPKEEKHDVLSRIYEQKEQHGKVNNFRSSLNPDNYDTKTELPKKGKHYALGDIHGYKEPYDIALKMIKPEDSLVLLGDVVDRGPDGVEILQDLIKRKANTPESNITFILGNHEKMMFEALCYILRLHLSPETISNINKCYDASRRQKNIYKSYQEEGIGDLKLAEALGKHCTAIKEKIKQTMSNNINIDKMIEDVGVWCQSKNGGKQTLQAFMNLDEDEQKNMFNFLGASYVMKQQEVQGRKILYVHSRPPKDINIVKKLNQSNDYGIRATELPYDEFYRVVWDREEDTYSQCKDLGFEIICGHEYEANTTIVNRQEGYTRIDEGCGHGNAFSVGLYCIEDNTVIHIGQDDKIFKTNCTGKIKIVDEKGKESIIEGTKIPQEHTR